VAVQAAQEELNAISADLQKRYPDYGRGTRAVIGQLDNFLVQRVKESLLALLGASGLIVLITCVNVANLLLMRAVRKRRETSVRFALGASRGRVVRQFLVESMLVATVGCGAGILLGRLLMRTLLALAPANIPRIAGVTMDWRVFAVSTAIATVTGLLFGIAPAWQASRTKPGEALKSSEKNTTAVSQMRWRAVFTIVEVALSLILLIGAGLLLNSFVRLTSVDLGFRTDHILSMNISLPGTRYRTGDLRLRFYQQLEERVRALPGVQSVAFANRLPLGAGAASGFSTELQPDAKLAAGYQVVSPGYFEMLGISLERGRLFTTDDRTGQPPVAVVNQMFAQRFLQGRDPLGLRLRRAPQFPWITIVGVVKDIRRDGLAKQMMPQFYLAAAQTEIYPAGLNDFGVLTAGDPHQLVNAIQQQVWAVDRDQTVINVRTLDEALTASVAERRFQTLLLAIYGVLSYSVSQRTPELGIRIALGADPREILAMVLRQAGRLIAVGVALGLAGAYALTRFVESMLFGVRPHDSLTYLAAVALLAVVSVAASLLPARRGSQVDPMVALRYE
jgi:putative ABC transport system permease protein